MGVKYNQESKTYSVFMYCSEKKDNRFFGEYKTREEAHSRRNEIIEEFDRYFAAIAQDYKSSRELSELTGVNLWSISAILFDHPKIKPPYGKNVFYLLEGAIETLKAFAARQAENPYYRKKQDPPKNFSLPPLDQFREVAREHKQHAERFWG